MKSLNDQMHVEFCKGIRSKLWNQLKGQLPNQLGAELWRPMSDLLCNQLDDKLRESL